MLSQWRADRENVLRSAQGTQASRSAMGPVGGRWPSIKHAEMTPPCALAFPRAKRIERRKMDASGDLIPEHRVATVLKRRALDRRRSCIAQRGPWRTGCGFGLQLLPSTPVRAAKIDRSAVVAETMTAQHMYQCVSACFILLPTHTFRTPSYEQDQQIRRF